MVYLCTSVWCGLWSLLLYSCGFGFVSCLLGVLVLLYFCDFTNSSSIVFQDQQTQCCCLYVCVCVLYVDLLVFDVLVGDVVVNGCVCCSVSFVVVCCCVFECVSVSIACCMVCLFAVVLYCCAFLLDALFVCLTCWLVLN